MNASKILGFLSVVMALHCTTFEADAAPWTFGPRSETISLGVSPDQKLYLTILVNDRELTFFIDTGASTILDSRLATELKIKTEITHAGFGISGVANDQAVGIVSSLAIGKMVVHDFPATFVDMSATKKLHADHGFPGIDGLIGSDILSALRATIDYDKKLLTVRRPRKSDK